MKIEIDISEKSFGKPTERLVFVLSKESKKALLRLCKEKGIGVSPFIRNLIDQVLQQSEAGKF